MPVPTLPLSDGEELVPVGQEQGAVCRDWGHVDGAAHVYFADQLLLLPRLEYPDIAIFIGQINLAVDHHGRTPHG
jgi:hypothetical protein